MPLVDISKNVPLSSDACEQRTSAQFAKALTNLEGEMIYLMFEVLLFVMAFFRIVEYQIAVRTPSDGAMPEVC